MNCVLDTNILVYTAAPTSDVRATRARDLVNRAIRHGSVVLLLQTLGEFADVALRKFRIDAVAVRDRIDAWRNVLPVRAATDADVMAALLTVRDHKIRFWDALLCAAAAQTGARYLLTEDLQDGRHLGGITIINPSSQLNDALIDSILPL